MKEEKMPIPGSEKLTRPEELKSLSKFLGNIKKVQDEHTELDQSILDVPGKTTGYIPEVNNLETRVEGLDVPGNIKLDTSVIGLENANGDLELSDIREGLDVPDNIQTLGSEIEKLDGVLDNIELGSEKEKLDVQGEITDLNPELLGLDINTTDLELSDGVEKLEIGEDNLTLGNEIVNLEVNSDTKLSEELDKLDTNNEVTALENGIDRLILETQEIELGNDNEKILGEILESENLESYKDSLYTDLDISLSTEKDILDVSLDKKEIELSNTKETLSDENKVDTLESTVDSLHVDSGIDKLEDEKIKLDPNKTDLELPREKINLNLPDSDLELPKEKDGLNVEDDIELPKTKEKIEVEDDIELPGTIDSLVVEDDIELPETKESLEVEEAINQLPETRDNIEIDDKIDQLSDTKESLEVEEVIDQLPETKDNIEVDDKLEQLPETKESLEVEDKLKQLPEIIDTLENPKDPTLSNYLEKINIPEVVDTLPETFFEIEVNSRSDDYITSIDNANPLGEVIGLAEKLENIDADEKLKGKIVTKSPDQHSDNSNIEELREELSDIPLDEQGNIVTKLDSQNPSSRFKDFLNLTNEAKELDKFKGIIRLLTDKNTALGKTSWASKIAALVTAYLNPDNITVDGKTTMVVGDIATYEHKLKELLAESTGIKDKKEFEEYYKLLIEEYKAENNYTENLPENQNPNYKNVEGLSISDSRRTDFSKYISWGGASNDDYGFPEGVPEYKLPGTITLNSLNITKYFRWCAEELLGLWKPKTAEGRKLRRMALDETLALIYLADQQLEILTKSNRDRLPGDDYGLLSNLVNGGVSGVVDSLKDSAKSALTSVFSKTAGDNYNNPINRPKVNQITGARELISSFEAANSRDDGDKNFNDDNFKQTAWKKFTSGITGKSSVAGNISFYDNYLCGYGIATTLEDLCEGNRTISTVEELLQTLEESPYISTPKKFGTLRAGEYGTMTLDTNSYWEITLEPYCSKENSTCNNGGWTYLPCIDSINTRNNLNHGIYTSYSKWIPFIGFELQKSRLTTKSLGLYDGEIVFPISSELSNDLRITIADDQYKSWRQYFQSCADVSIYNSVARFRGSETFSVTKSKLLINNTLGTATKVSYIDQDNLPCVDKTSIIISNYKNITFRIKVYVMTPQFSTIRKFDLLCVMKDFMEEYSGDIDSGATDLTINFSIVGENPGVSKGSNIITLPTNRTKTSEEVTINRYSKKPTNLIKLL